MTIAQHQTKSPNLCQFIGGYILKNHPEMAQEIVAQNVNAGALETDFSKIPEYHKNFLPLCDETKKSEVNALFAAAIIRIYAPNLFNQSGQIYFGKNGYAKHIAASLNISRSAVARLIRKTVLWNKLYSDFAEKADIIVQKIHPC